MRKLHGILTVVILAAASAPRLQAADATFYVGGISPGDLRTGIQKIPLDGGTTLGFRLSTNFIPMIGLEHTFGFGTNFLVPHNQPAFEDAKGFLYNTNLIVNIPLGRFVPYVTAGAGFIWQYGAEDLPVGTEFAVNYGGGLKCRLFGPAGIRVDARGYTTTEVRDSNLNMFEMSAGFYVSF